MSCSCAGALSGNLAGQKNGESAVRVQTVKLICQIAKSLPDMSPEIVDFWTNNGIEFPELKNVLAILNSPETISAAKKSERRRVAREYGKVNS